MLCEPLQRAQSALYHFRGVILDHLVHGDGVASLPSLRHIGTNPWLSFHDMVHRDVTSGVLEGDLYDVGRYGAQLEEWLNATGRLSVVPLPLYAEYEASVLGQLECQVTIRSSHHANCTMPSSAARTMSSDAPPLLGSRMCTLSWFMHAYALRVRCLAEQVTHTDLATPYIRAYIHTYMAGGLPVSPWHTYIHTWQVAYLHNYIHTYMAGGLPVSPRRRCAGRDM